MSNILTNLLKEKFVRLIFLPCVCFASIYASMAAKSYILNYMWTAANFIIEGRMRPHGRRLCTVAPHESFLIRERQMVANHCCLLKVHNNT